MVVKACAESDQHVPFSTITMLSPAIFASNALILNDVLTFLKFCENVARTRCFS